MSGSNTQLPAVFIKHKRKISVTLSILVVYGLAGFFLLPWFIERQLVNISQQRLALSTSVESIYFNPFTFYFEVDSLQISEAQGDRLFSLSHLHTNFQPSRFVLLKAQLAELVANGLIVDLDRSSETENTLNDLAARWANSNPNPSAEAEEPETGQSTELFPFELLVLELSDIDIHLSDSSLPTPFATTVGIERIRVEDLSTLADAAGRHDILINFEQQAQLSIAGDFSINPLLLSGNISLENFPLNTLSRYGQDSLPATIDSGQLSIGLDYDVDLTQDTPNIAINRINTQLQSLAVVENDEDSPFLEVNELGLASGTVSYPANQAVLENLTLNGLALNADINSDNELNLVRMLNAVSENSEQSQAAPERSPQSSATESAAEESSPWVVELNRFNIEDLAMAFSDDSLTQNFTAAATVNGSISELSNVDDSEFPVTLAVEIASGGSIALEGQLQALPELDLDAAISVTSLALPAIQPYLNEFVFAELQQGSLDLNSQLTIDASQPLLLTGALSLSDLVAIDSVLEETLVSFEELAVDAVTFSAADNAAEISEITLESLFARVIINEDGSSNIGRSIKSADEGAESEINESAIEEEISAAAPLAITVGQVLISNGSANFTDKDLPIEFNANITNLSGSAEGFSNNTSQATNISLEGEVDDYGLVRINSALMPFALTQQTQLNVAFTNIDMPAMTPYVIKFAGREIVDGSVDLTLNYDVEGGDLDANNQLILNDLKLGKRIESPDAMDLPLDLALALLKDSNGVIDLEVPVNGNVNDPEFDFGPAIRRALGNVLTNIVTAPFRLLGGLVGSGDDELDHIRFLPGRSDIAAPERQILVQLSEALKLRPQLALEVSPVASEADLLALKTAAVDTEIEAALAATENNGELLTNRRRQALEGLYAQTSASAALAEIESLHTESSPEDSSDTSVEPSLDVIAYNADLLQRLIDVKQISDAELASLANMRAQAAADFLINEGAIEASRIRFADSSTSELDDDGWLTMDFELGSLD